MALLGAPVAATALRIPLDRRSALHLRAAPAAAALRNPRALSCSKALRFKPALASTVPATTTIMATKDSGSSSGKNKGKRTSKTARDKAFGFLEQHSGFFWILGPVLATSAVLLPGLAFSVPQLLQRNYWVGFGAILGLDLIFVLAADAFFVLSDKTARYQRLPGGPTPWIGPWEYTGYPRGLPQAWEYICYAGVAIAAVAMLVSVFLGQLPVTLAALVPYTVLIFIQGAYERLLCNDRLPTFPLVPVVFTAYRFRQLARALELLAVFRAGGGFLASATRCLMGLWTFYLASYLSQLPWLYSTWNSNKAM